MKDKDWNIVGDNKSHMKFTIPIKQRKNWLGFCKKQLLRSINMVKSHWDFMVVEFPDEMGLTWFGEWFLRTMMFGLFICYIPIVIVFIPLWLVIFKYDESIFF